MWNLKYKINEQTKQKKLVDTESKLVVHTWEGDWETWVKGERDEEVQVASY